MMHGQKNMKLLKGWSGSASNRGHTHAVLCHE